MSHNEDYPGYVQAIKRHYGAVVHVLWYVVTETSDRGADIAARALALLAPLPNAVSVYNVSQHNLGYSHTQALAFALAMELALFAIIEVALHMWDGFLGNRKRYAWPLGVSIAAALGVLAIVVSVVYNLEVKTGGHWILASLPFISLFAFVALGLKRWHERPVAQRTAQAKRTKTHNLHSASSVTHTMQTNAQDAQSPVISKKQRAIQMHRAGVPIVQIAADLDVHRNTASNWVRSTNGYSKEATR